MNKLRKTKITRREFLRDAAVAAGMLGIGGLTSACSPTPTTEATEAPSAATPTAAPSPTTPAEKEVLRFLNQGNAFQEDENAPLSKLIREWEELHPNLTIAVENYGWDDGHDKYSTILRAGETVDLGYGQADWMPEFAELGAIEPIENWVDSAIIDDLFEGVRKTCTWKETVYMLPSAASLRALIYRPDWFEEAGLSHPPDTVDDVLNAAAAIHKPPDRYGFGTCISRHKNTVEFFLPFFWAFGGEIFDNDDDPTTVRFNEAEGAEALEYYVELCQYAQPGFEQHDVYDVLTLFNEGKCAMQHNDAKAITNINEEIKDQVKWGIALPPKYRKRNCWSVIDVCYMFATGKHKEEVADFWKLRYRTETVTEFLKQYDLMPFSHSVAADPYYQTHPVLKGFADAGQYGRFLPKAPAYAQVSDALSVAIAKAVLGQASAKDALDEAAATALAFMA